jgi:DNA invertase Pin-like site-specific DNA recombinase
MMLGATGDHADNSATAAVKDRARFFAEFERAMVQERVRADIARAKADGKMAAEIEEPIREALQDGRRIVSTAKAHGCGVSAVQLIKSEMVAESTARPA